jgi:hypothetical protein
MANEVGKKGKKRRRSHRRAIVGATAAKSSGNRLTKAKEAAMSEKHTLTALAAAAAVGFAKRQGFNLPHLPMMGPAATYGLASWALAKYTGNKIASHAATGLLSVAIYELAAGGGVAGDVGADEVLGDDSIVGEW